MAFPVPGRYVGAGGFFDWLFYWDSYFIVLGLVSTEEHALAGEVVDALLAEVDAFGFVPNFNAPHCVCLSRSQPPLLTSMIREVAQTRNLDWLDRASGLAAREYDGYWCTAPHRRPARPQPLRGQRRPVPDRPGHAALQSGRRERLGQHTAIRRRRDGRRPGRPERPPLPVRARPRRIRPPARPRARGARVGQPREGAARSDRPVALGRSRGLYRDLSLSRRAPLERVPRSLALYVPLWAGAATPAQAALCRAQLPVFECSHGLASCEPGWFDGSEHNHPIGWAYSHWFAVEGLRRYGYAGDAERVARKWVGLVALRHAATGSFFERYDVVDPGRAVAGRYETQTGFGWTNGVFLALSLLSIGAGGRSAPARP